MSFEDLKALEDLLLKATNDDDGTIYFFGRSHPSVLDCTVFSHLSQFLYIRMDFPQKKFLNEKCPALLRFMEHFKQTHFPDWETKCQKQPNDSLRSDHPRMQAFTNKMRRKLGGTVAVVVAVAGLVAYYTVVKPSRQGR